MEHDPRNTFPKSPDVKSSVRSSIVDEMGGFADPATVRGHVKQLNLLTSRLEEFLTCQIERLQKMDASSGIGQAASSDELDRTIDEFEQVRRNWEVERQTAEDRLQHDAERLQAAWQDLEMEQRQLLSQQAAVRSTARVAVSAAPVAGPTASSGMYPTRSAVSRPVVTTTSTRSGDSEMTPSHRAQVQFQQLRREMQKHAQRRNKR